MGIDDSTGVLVNASRLSKEKNFQELISFLPILLEKGIDTKLLIVGDGPYKKKLEKLTDTFRLRDSVIFTGRVPSEDVWRYYDAGDVFVSASTFEVHSMSYLEALANGLLEDNKNGMIYHSETEFIDYAVKILCNDELRKEMGLRSMKKAEDFSSDAFAGAMLSVYEDAIIKKQLSGKRKNEG